MSKNGCDGRRGARRPGFENGLLRMRDKAMLGCAAFPCLVAAVVFIYAGAAFGAPLFAAALAICAVVLARVHVRAGLRSMCGMGLPPAELARRLGMTTSDLKSFKPGYSEVSIPKKRGGMRRLHVPDEATCELQRKILRRLLAALKTHDCAHGFEKGRSIVSNALPHAGKAVVLTLDLVDFFPSTSAGRVDAYFRRIGWNGEAASILARLVTREGGLPQGAPTSPRLSNLINYGMDEEIRSRLCGRKGVDYTRYGDDMTVSFERDDPVRVRGAIQIVGRIAGKYGYRLHRRKTRLRRRHRRQMVTGLVVNDGVRVPRKVRRWLRAVEHRLLHDPSSATVSIAQAMGWRSYVGMVEAAVASAKTGSDAPSRDGERAGDPEGADR